MLNEVGSITTFGKKTQELHLFFFYYFLTLSFSISLFWHHLTAKESMRTAKDNAALLYCYAW